MARAKRRSKKIQLNELGHKILEADTQSKRQEVSNAVRSAGFPTIADYLLDKNASPSLMQLARAVSH